MELARRRATRWLVVPAAAALVALGVSSPAQGQQNTLRGAAGQMLVGVATEPQWLGNSTYTNIAAAEFSSVTAENQMKMDQLQPNEGQFNFGPADQIVDFAQQNNQNVYGHTLVWHSQAPGWVQGLSGGAMDAAMQNHIETVMQHYQGSVSQWDVINEVLEEDGSMRQSFWLNGLGPDYINDAFHYARAADPSATLCMNDFNNHSLNHAKSDAYFQIAQDMLASGVPLDCMAFQTHLVLGEMPGTQMLQNVQRFANLGLDIWITEVDIRIQMPATQQELQQQAQEYAQVFSVCQQVSACQGVTVWGLHDAQSWVPDHFQGEGAPLLWDDNFNPKPAYDAVLTQLGGSGGPGPSPTPTVPPSPSPTPTGGPPGDCAVSYDVNDWGGHPGFTASVDITNTGGSAIDGWQLQWDFPAGQVVNDHWNSTITQSGSTVTVSPAGWNSTINPSQTVNIGFNGEATSAGNNPPPTSFTLNGTSCTVS